MFDVWVGQPELRWARLAWERLLERGLGNYGNPTEKCMVKIRFLALAGFYHDFCYVAWRVEAYPDYQVWAELLEIHSFSLGQLAGTSAEWSEEDTGCVVGYTEVIRTCRRWVCEISPFIGS